MDVALLLADGVADFGLAAVREVLDMANALTEELDPPPQPWTVHTVAVGDSVRSASESSIPTTPILTLADRLDLLLVPAVNVLRADALIELVSSPENHQMRELIAHAWHNGTQLAAACTGTFFLAESGVLDGAAATTSWWLGPAFRRRYPKVKLKVGQTLCRGERVMTAGAVLSHLDLALSLVSSRSPALADLVCRYMMIGNRNTQHDFMIPEVIARGHPLVAAFELWVRDHLAEGFHISAVAETLGVTERTLQRVTAAELGMSPREFVTTIRLEQATRLLRDTTLTVDTIASRVGYLNGSTLRGLIRRRGMAIADIRAARPSFSPQAHR